MQTCKGICEYHKVRVTIPKIFSRFYFAIKCSSCCEWLPINGVKFGLNDKMFCLCCGEILRRRPHSKGGKVLYKKTEEMLL